MTCQDPPCRGLQLGSGGERGCERATDTGVDTSLCPQMVTGKSTHQVGQGTLARNVGEVPFRFKPEC